MKPSIENNTDAKAQQKRKVKSVFKKDVEIVDLKFKKRKLDVDTKQKNCC